MAEPSVDPFATAGSCYLYVDDADGLFAEWRGLIPTDVGTGSRLTSPTDTEYAMREFAVVDKSGNLIRLGTPVRSSA